MGEVFRGIKVRDWALAGALTVLGVLLMVRNVDSPTPRSATPSPTGSMAHPMSSHSLWMIPVFAGATVPVLWWRRSVIAVTAVAIGVMVLHDLLFGWVTRCGAGLPLAFVLAFLGALGYRRAKAWIACGLAAALTAAVLAIDATTGPDALVLALPVLLIVFGVGPGRPAPRRPEPELQDQRGGAATAARRACRR